MRWELGGNWNIYFEPIYHTNVNTIDKYKLFFSVSGKERFRSIIIIFLLQRPKKVTSYISTDLIFL